KAELAKLERQSSGAKQFRAVDGVAIKAAHSAKVQAKWDRWRSDQQMADDKRMARNRAISESYAVQKRFRDEAAARRKAHLQSVADNKFSLRRQLGSGDGLSGAIFGQGGGSAAAGALRGIAASLGAATVAVGVLGAAIAGKLTYEITRGTIAA